MLLIDFIRRMESYIPPHHTPHTFMASADAAPLLFFNKSHSMPSLCHRVDTCWISRYNFTLSLDAVFTNQTTALRDGFAILVYQPREFS